MNEGVDQPWSQAEHLPHIDDEFSPFFDLESTGIDLSILDENANGTNWQQDGGLQQNNFTTMEFAGTASYQQHFNMSHPESQPYHGHFSVPPTPNSSEMYANPSQYNPHSDARGQFPFNGYQQRGANTFTPMVSPDVPAVNSAGSFVPQYTRPGEYLSPLTSPAINPQVMPQTENSQTSTANSSLATSPALNGFESIEDAQSSNSRPRKTRKKSTTMPTPPAKGRQAVTTKSLRSRTGSAKKNGKENPSSQNSNGLHSELNSHATSRSTSLEHTNSGSKSVSPNPISERTMAPPPKPSPNAGTPSMTPQQRGKTTGESTGLPPATPASIMRQSKNTNLSNQSQFSPDSQLDGISRTIGELGNGMEDLRLPEAATIARSNQPSGPSKILPQSAPNSAPQTPLSIATPSSTALEARGKLEGKPALGIRKRGSTASTSHISPAVRPRISPSIKPLLPEGANPISHEAHALILASKSNYQNILEGNQLISYPSELSNNLTHKRTSHKLAEQGRRNRINVALQEMQSLLPPSLSVTSSKEHSSDGNCDSRTPHPDDADTKNGDRTPTTPVAPNNSKAATVEMAIVHIKEMHNKLTTKELENEQLREELRALQAKLGDDDNDVSNEA